MSGPQYEMAAMIHNVDSTSNQSFQTLGISKAGHGNPMPLSVVFSLYLYFLAPFFFKDSPASLELIEVVSE